MYRYISIRASSTRRAPHFHSCSELSSTYHPHFLTRFLFLIQSKYPQKFYYSTSVIIHSLTPRKNFLTSPLTPTTLIPQQTALQSTDSTDISSPPAPTLTRNTYPNSSCTGPYTHPPSQPHRAISHPRLLLKLITYEIPVLPDPRFHEVNCNIETI